jgi:hypothetical protein
LPAHGRGVFEATGNNVILETGPEQNLYAVEVHEIKRDYLNVKGEVVNTNTGGIPAAFLFSDNPVPGDNFTVSLKCDGEPEGRIGLYFNLAGVPGGKLSPEAFVYMRVSYAWEYLSPDDGGTTWKPFRIRSLNDETYSLARSGIFEFAVPSDIAVNAVGEERFIRIRGRLTGGPPGASTKPVYFERTPRLKELLPNPVIVYGKRTVVTVSDVVRAESGGSDPVNIRVPFDPDVWDYLVQERENEDGPWNDLEPGNFSFIPAPSNGTYLIVIENPGNAEFRLIYWEKYRPVAYSAAEPVRDGLNVTVGFSIEVEGAPSSYVYSVQWRKGSDGLWVDLDPTGYTMSVPTATGTVDITVDNLKCGELRVSALAGTDFMDELCTAASGLPDLRIELPEPALAGFAVQVEESALGWFDWEETDELRLAGKDERCFVLSPDRRRLIFGDGRNGRVPPAPTGGTPNVRVTTYAVSEGFTGKIPSTARYEIGRQSETIKEAVWRTREDLAEPPVAVTLEDYEHFALATPGLEVARSEALVVPVESNVWSFCKKKTLIETPEVHRVVVVVIPDTDRRPPEPGTAFLRTVRRFLERFRVVTTRLDVEAPVYAFISLRVTIVVSGGYAHGEVAKSVRDELVGFLDPLVGGEEKSGWRLGRSIYRSGIVAVAESVPGMDRVTDFRVWSEGQVIPDGQTEELKLKWNELPFLVKERVYVETVPGDICP